MKVEHNAGRGGRMAGMRRSVARVAATVCLLALSTGATLAETATAIAMHGTPAAAPGFARFSAVDPGAVPGGRLRQGVLGSFDSLNPFIIKGVPVAGIRDNVAESLMTRGLDDAFALYGLLAETIDVPEDRSSVTFKLNPNARFSDGRPVTVADVLFSFNVLREKGRPNHRAYFKKVTAAERLDDMTVRFVFDATGDRELPLILGLMPVLPSHLLTAETFEQTTLAGFIGSGPYKISRIDAGRAITYTRDPNYWGNDLPVNRHRYNFGELRFEYFRDNAVMFEAFKSGQLDLRFEDDPAVWSQGYDFAAVRDGGIVKSEMAATQPAGMTALVFNTRRSVFANPKVRAALIELFDFEFANSNLYAGLYKRTQSYFERSMLSAHGRPADVEERRLLAPFSAAVRPDVLDGTFAFPKTDGTGRNRANLQKAVTLLEGAGFTMRNGRVFDGAGQPLAFEILVNASSSLPMLNGFKNDLARIGIAASVRRVDSAQYQTRLRTYDYDMIQTTWPSSLSPGNEQLFRWSGPVGRQEGSFNFAGVDNPAADAMIAAMLGAGEPGAFVSAVRALDRVLISGDYVIPLFHVPSHWVAHARHVRYPKMPPVAGLAIDTWWSEAK
jgi:peptide/nickel transport system substrate-binding protein